MKIINPIAKSIAFIGLALLAVNCSDDENDGPEKIPLFTEADKSMIHGDDQKSWHIAEVVNYYYDPNYDLEITTECVTDDVYTFTAGKEEVTIDYGDVLCFEDIEDGIFTADHEFFESNLRTFDMDFGQTLYLHFARGYMNDSGSAMGVTFTHYRLTELSEDRMVFTKGTEHLGYYKQALIFEVIE